MANASMIFREFRYIIHDHSIEVYVHIEAVGDCPLGVQGWHYKHFVDGVPDKDIIAGRERPGGVWSAENISLTDSVMWPQKAP